MRYLFVIFLFSTLSFAKVYTDMLNRDVTVTNSNKILAIGPGALRLITYMQLQNKLAGVEKIELRFDPKAPYKKALDKKFIRSLPIIGQGGPSKMPNIEAIIKSGADVIFVSFLSKKQVNLLQSKTTIPVVALSYGQNYGGLDSSNKLEAVKNSLSLLGKITNTTSRAQELINFMDKLDTLLHNTMIDKKAYIGGIGYKGIKGLTSTDSNYLPFKLLRVQNSIAFDKSGHSQISYETLLLNDPAVIFIDMLAKKIVNEELRQNKAMLKNLKAYKNRDIHWLYPYNFYNTNIENVYINSFIIAKKLGVTLDLQKIKQQIYKKFLNQTLQTRLPQFNYDF